MCIQRWLKDLKGMSDLCIYELQDNVWDEFGESDDHIVPQSANEVENHCTVQSDSCKKLRLEVAGPTSNADSVANFVVLGKKETNSETLSKKDKMLEKDSWSHAPDAVFPASCDNVSSKDITSVTSDDPRMSAQCFKSDNDSVFCADDHIMGERCATTDNNMYSYSLNHISQTESDLNFFNDGDKESNDLYYGWPDIGNFDDVDKMFRNCDSTFGLGSLSNDDDLSWFSPSHAIEGSEDAVKSGFKFSCSESNGMKNAAETCEKSFPSREPFSLNDPEKGSANITDSLSMEVTGAVESAILGHSSSVYWSGAKSESKEDSVSKKETNLCRKQSKLPNQSEGKRKERYIENGSSLQHHGHLDQFGGVEVPFSDSSHQIHSPYMHSAYFHHMNQVSGCSSLSALKSENEGQPSPTPKESSFASNQASLARNFNHVDVASPNASISDPVAVLKRVHQSETVIEGRSSSEAEGAGVVVPAEVDSSLVQESSCMSSVLDEISLEATSFRQLQRVMEQLDIKTKLCIRDSLYRLARSAEQRHNCANPSVGSKNDGACNGVMTAEETSKCNGFMDMETDTNPIDRSVAHLLFHRPSDPSTLPSSGASSPKSHAMIHRAVMSPPLISETETGYEEMVADAEKVT